MKRYLGDSVYAEHDGWNIILTTDNGYGPSNTVILEPSVFQSLLTFKERLDEANDDDE